MSGLRFARGSAKGGKLMQDCCFTCKNLEYRQMQEFGKTVFLSREEAEKALQEMEGKKDG